MFKRYGHVHIEEQKHGLNRTYKMTTMEYINTLDRMEKSLHKHKEILSSYKQWNEICLDDLTNASAQSGS